MFQFHPGLEKQRRLSPNQSGIGSPFVHRCCMVDRANSGANSKQMDLILVTLFFLPAPPFLCQQEIQPHWEASSFYFYTRQTQALLLSHLLLGPREFQPTATAFALGQCSSSSQAFLPVLIEQTVASYFHAVKLFLFPGTRCVGTTELLRGETGLCWALGMHRAGRLKHA